MQREVEALGVGFAPRDLLRLAVEAQNVADEDNATRDASHARRSRDPPLDRTLGITAKGSGHVDVALGPQVRHPAAVRCRHRHSRFTPCQALAAAPSAESSARQASSLDESVDGKGVAHVRALRLAPRRAAPPLLNSPRPRSASGLAPSCSWASTPWQPLWQRPWPAPAHASLWWWTSRRCLPPTSACA